MLPENLKPCVKKKELTPMPKSLIVITDRRIETHDFKATLESEPVTHVKKICLRVFKNNGIKYDPSKESKKLVNTTKNKIF